jgi:hypothetical protein
MSRFDLDLTHNNAKKLMSGQPTQIMHKQFAGNKHYLVLHPLNHKKLSQAKAKGKGARLTLSPDELAASGEGFRDLWNKVKRGAMIIKDKVIDTPTYQTLIKPLVRKGVDSLATAISAELPAAAPLINAGVQKLSGVTNAFGVQPLALKQPRKRTAKPRAAKPRASKKAAGGSFVIN